MDFFRIIGCGRIGKSRYQIYDLLSPMDIYDEQTAAELEGIFLVGDDFAGNCEAYDTRDKWQFGSVGSSGTFQPHPLYKNFVEFIEAWYAMD